MIRILLFATLAWLSGSANLRWPKTYHLTWPRWKHEENSLLGIRTAHRLGFKAIDLDLLITKDGVIVLCHWMFPQRRDNMFDPNGRIAVREAVRDLTWDELRTLRSRDHDHHYRIVRIERGLAECNRIGIKPALEPKNDKRFEEDWPWQHILEIVRKLGRKPRWLHVASIRNLGGKGAGVRRVRAAIRNGVPSNHTKILF